jgi:ssDNA-binding replication factor A large subunit
LISKRPDYTKEKILDLVREKRSKVGAGYLTDQGALFLVASDLNVSLKFDQTPKRVTLRDLKDEQRGISIVARLLSIGLPRRFERSSDSKDGFLLKITVYDDTKMIVPCTVWDYGNGSKIITSMNPGTAVKISNCYTKAGIDGTQSLNIADTTEISILEESDTVAKQIPGPEILATTLEKALVGETSRYQVIRAAIAEPVRKVEFTRSKDGSQRHFLSFSLKPSESQDASATRVVLWGNTNPVFEKFAPGETITLASLRARSNNFQGANQIELHGDDSTIVLEKWEETKSHLNFELEQLGRYFLNKDSQNTRTSSSALTPFVARILSVGTAVSGENSSHLLIMDSTKRIISLTAFDEAAKDSSILQTDDVILCKPDTFDEIGMRAVCKKSASLSKLKPERKDIPKSSSLVTLIEKFEPGSIVSLDAMTLSETVAREIQTKEGSLVRRTEISLADPSGEIMIFAWRSLSKHLEGLKPGMRVWIRAAEVQSHEGKKFLLLKNYSRIEPKEEEMEN